MNEIRILWFIAISIQPAWHHLRITAWNIYEGFEIEIDFNDE